MSDEGGSLLVYVCSNRLDEIRVHAGLGWAPINPGHSATHVVVVKYERREGDTVG